MMCIQYSSLSCESVNDGSGRTIIYGCLQEPQGQLQSSEMIIGSGSFKHTQKLETLYQKSCLAVAPQEEDSYMVMARSQAAMVKGSWSFNRSSEPVCGRARSSQEVEEADIEISCRSTPTDPLDGRVWT